MDPQQYVTDIKAKLVASSAVAAIAVVEERILPDRGYFRARLTLSNDDFPSRTFRTSPIMSMRGKKPVLRRARH